MIRTATSCKFYKTIGLALCAILGVPLSAPAAWLGYRNDTKSVIVVQTSISVNGRIIHGKAHTLFPGEVAWDNIPAPGTRQIVIADPKANNRIVASETINVQNQDVFLSAQMFQPPQVPGKAPVPPVVRLVGIKAPGATPATPKSDPNPGSKGGGPAVPKGNLPPTVTPKAPETPKGKTPDVPKGKLPPSVNPPSTAPKETPKEAPKGSSTPIVPPKTKSG